MRPSMTLEQWATVAQIALAVATIGLAAATYAIVREMRRTRQATDLPYVVAYAELIQSARLGATGIGSIPRLLMTIENVGRRPAFHIKIWRSDAVDWPLPSEPKAIEIPFLPAGVPHRRDAFDGSPRPSVPVHAEWHDEFGKTYSAEFVVEWRPAFS